MDVEALLGKTWLKSTGRSDGMFAVSKIAPFSSLFLSDVSGGGAVAHGAQGERGGLSSVLRDFVKPGDENLREMNKKLQNMLEEQLTKNMHLQKVKRGKASRLGWERQAFMIKVSLGWI